MLHPWIFLWKAALSFGRAAQQHPVEVQISLAGPCFGGATAEGDRGTDRIGS